MCYYDLAHFLGPEQPFYAFQSYGIDGDSRLVSRIEDMACAYIEEMRTVQSHGPYLLGGWSMGGIVAYEMAQQLLASGEEVALLALFDTTLPSLESQEQETDSDSILRNLFIAGNEAYIPPSVLEQPLVDRILHVIETGKELKVLPPDFELSHAMRIVEVIKCNAYAMNMYRWQPYAGKVTYFLANEEHGYEIEEFVKKLKQFGAEVECYETPGSHNRLMDKANAKAIAERLSRILSSL